ICYYAITHLKAKKQTMVLQSLGEAYLKRSTDARVSLHGYLVGVGMTLLPTVLACSILTSNNYSNSFPWQQLLCGCLSAGLFAALCRWIVLPVSSYPNYWENAKRALFLGWAFSSGTLLAVYSRDYWTFGVYICYLSFFHWSEYWVTAVTNPATLRLSSYMLDHSPEYHLAALISWAEFWLEALLVPWLKSYSLPIATGLAMCTAGELFRKLAMITAGRNFNHVVEHKKRTDHVLVTSGVYSWVRHPAYTGWFAWAIGTQLLLCNPVSIVGYTLASWRFFRERINEEERLLINFFNQAYLDYQRTTWSGVPFVRGYFVRV
ncbi:hypothetical protein BOX15_Mlig026624g1, partial [Macrostomum lignano]